MILSKIEMNPDWGVVLPGLVMMVLAVFSPKLYAALKPLVSNLIAPKSEGADSNATEETLTDPAVIRDPSQETRSYVKKIKDVLGDDADDELILECLVNGDSPYEAIKRHRDKLLKGVSGTK